VEVAADAAVQKPMRLNRKNSMVFSYRRGRRDHPRLP
jgi:hypothetical protein